MALARHLVATLRHQGLVPLSPGQDCTSVCLKRGEELLADPSALARSISEPPTKCPLPGPNATE